MSASNNNAFLIGVGCWLLAASVLVYGYSSVVVSSITLPIQMPTVNTFEDVVAHPDISLIVRTDTYIGSLVNTVKLRLIHCLDINGKSEVSFSIEHRRTSVQGPSRKGHEAARINWQRGRNQLDETSTYGKIRLSFCEFLSHLHCMQLNCLVN